MAIFKKYYYDFETSVPKLNGKSINNFELDELIDIHRNREHLEAHVKSWCITTKGRDLKIGENILTEKVVSRKFNRSFYYFGLTIDDFFDTIFKIKNDKIEWYANNASHFDLHYILTRLKEYKFKQHDKNCCMFKYTKNHNYQYDYLISGNKGIIVLKIVINNTIHLFYDLIRIVNASVDKMGETLGKSKLDGFEVYRGSDYTSLEDLFTRNDGKDVFYLQRDVEIIKDYHTKFIEEALKIDIKIPQKPSISGIAYDLYKNNPLVKGNYDFYDNDWLLKPYDDRQTIFQYLRKYYRGGFTYLNPKYKNINIKKHISLDVNSQYPSVMASDVILPIGECRIYDQPPLIFNPQYYYLLELIVWTECDEPNNFYFIPYRKNESYIKGKIPPRTTLYLSIPEYNLFKKHYTGITSIVKVVEFDGITAKSAFGSFVSFFYKLKNGTNKFLTIIAKLLLNSLYGKFGENVYGTEWQFNEQLNDWQQVKKPERTPNYLPLSIAITSYARTMLIEATYKCINNGITPFYWDTDCIKLLGWETPPINIDDKTLGYWKLEGKYTNGCYRNKKQYCTTEDFLIEKKSHLLKSKPQIEKSTKTKWKLAGFRLKDNEQILINGKSKHVKDLSFKDFFGEIRSYNQLKSYKGKNGAILYSCEKSLESIEGENNE